jgi:hypothetical protein
MSEAFDRLCAWENLLDAHRKAARGKRGQGAAACFEFALADRLLELKRELETGQYRPGGYVNFFIHEPKRRKISAAPFRDRVVHHALCNVIEPRFERLFIADSYANRAGERGRTGPSTGCSISHSVIAMCCGPTSSNTSPRSTTRSCTRYWRASSPKRTSWR